MPNTATLLLLRAAVILALTLPVISSYHYSIDSSDMDHMARSSLPSPVSSSSSTSMRYQELGPRLPTSPRTLRKKRISQMSCHCCSNSFNSHCCLKCMQRVGKRSGAIDVFDARPPTDQLEDSFAFNPMGDELLLYPTDNQSHVNSQYASSSPSSDEGEDGGQLGIRCLCCLSQMRENPRATKWPCCLKCFNHRQ